MSFWLVLWIVISALLLGFMVWSLWILFQQKRAWKAFAKTHKLRYQTNALMDGPEMDGTINDYKISFFSSEHMTPDMRGSRKLIAVEVNLHGVLPADVALGSGLMVPIVKGVDLQFEVKPEHEGWSKAYIATSSNRHVLKAYLDDARLDALTQLMKIKNAGLAFVCLKGRMLLRVDMASPMASQAMLEKFVKLFLKAARTLDVGPEEVKALKAEEARGVVKDSSLTLNDEGVDEVSGLQLEEEVASDIDGEVTADAVEEEAKEAEPKKKKPAKKTKSKPKG